MENRIINKSKLTFNDMYHGFVYKKYWFTLTYQIFSLIFLCTLIYAIVDIHPDQYYRLLVSIVFLVLSLTIGFLYPIFRALNWKNTAMRKSNNNYLDCNFSFFDVYLKVSSNVENYDFKLNYSDIVKIKTTKKYLMLITEDERFAICKIDGFANTNDVDEVKRLIRRIAKKA